jgi:L-arabinokinase
MRTIAYYITAHGYGHGTRSCDVLKALHAAAPEQPVIVTTDLPLDFLKNRLVGCNHITFRPGSFDVGLIQKDSIQSDLFQTLEKLETLYNQEETLIVQEQNFFRENDIGLVVADIPAIPLAAAQRSNITNIAIGNFSWDWIYEEYAKTDFHWEHFVEKFRAVYEQTDLLLRLPFAPPMEQFPNRKNIPLLATAGTPRRDKIRNSKLEARNKLLNSNLENPQLVSDLEIRNSKFLPDPGRQWVLLSFTSLNLDFQALENIRQLSSEYEFFCMQPLDFPDSCIHSIDRDDVCFADALASCDVVISKPGFGLVSECIVNNKPLIYADRDDFAEYPYLVAGIEKYLKNIHLPSEKLYAGDFFQALEKIKTAPTPNGFIRRSGAETIAEELLQRIV